MKSVTVLAMQNTMAATVTSPMDVFYQAGVMWNFFYGKAVTPYFDVRMVTSTHNLFCLLFTFSSFYSNATRNCFFLRDYCPGTRSRYLFAASPPLWKMGMIRLRDVLFYHPKVTQELLLLDQKSQ